MNGLSLRELYRLNRNDPQNENENIAWALISGVVEELLGNGEECDHRAPVRPDVRKVREAPDLGKKMVVMPMAIRQLVNLRNKRRRLARESDNNDLYMSCLSCYNCVTQNFKIGELSPDDEEDIEKIDDNLRSALNLRKEAMIAKWKDKMQNADALSKWTSEDIDDDCLINVPQCASDASLLEESSKKFKKLWTDEGKVEPLALHELIQRFATKLVHPCEAKDIYYYRWGDVSETSHSNVAE